MGNKSLLVAQREYVENLRTKAFWIGIIFFPVLLILSIVVPRWLERTKDARKFAVVDASGWLLQEVEDRAAMPDLVKVFRDALEQKQSGRESYQEFPASVRAVIDGLPLATEAFANMKGEGEPEDYEGDVLRTVAQVLTEIDKPESTAAAALAKYAPDQLAVLKRERDAIRDWWKALPPGEAKKYGESLAKSRYVRVEAPGTDEAALEALNQQVADEKLFAYFVIDANPMVEAGPVGRYVSQNLTDDDLRRWFTDLASDAVRERRIDEQGIDKSVADLLRKNVQFEEKKVGKSGKEEEVKDEDQMRQWAPVGFVYLLWIAIFSISQMLLTNTIEEKSNRILEVLLSSVSPIQLMLGKIIGIALTGLTMVLSWVACFLVVTKVFGDSMGGNVAESLQKIAHDPVLLGSFVAYFLLGYLFFAALLVGIGSVCNSVKEANNLMMPVTVMLMLPLLSMVPIGKDPNGALAKVLSYIPPFTPFVMMNRAAGPPKDWEYVVTTLLLLASIALVMWGAAKIFRIGILMTGKAPTPLEMLRWLKAPVGAVPVRREPGDTDAPAAPR